jgi:hypothetical protein
LSPPQQGTRPEKTSYMFPDTGHYVLRSDWGGDKGESFEDARWLLLRTGKFGSHGHWDLNSIILYAYGRLLLLDPGRTSYDNPLMPVLSSNKSHNVLLVDDQRMNRVNPLLNAWHTTPAIDLVDASYNGLYNGVDHRRAIVFVRPDYYVVFDSAKGKEPHDYGLNFWLTPPDVSISQALGEVKSNDSKGSNILLKSAEATGVEITDRKGSLDLDGIRNDIPVVTFHRKGAADAQFATVLYPVPPGVEAKGVETTLKSDTKGKLCTIRTPKSVDFVFYNGETGGACSADTCAFAGRAGLVRTLDGRTPTAFGIIDGTSCQFNAKALATSEKPMEELSVRYFADYVEVTCAKPEPSLMVASLGRTAAVVNGKKMDVSSEMFRPF